MKHLSEYIRESIFDMEDHVASFDDGVLKVSLNDPNGEFHKDWLSRYRKCKADVQRDTLILYGNTIQPMQNAKDLKYYGITQKKLYVPGDITLSLYKDTTPERVGKDLYCRRIDASGMTIKDVNIHVMQQELSGIDHSKFGIKGYLRPDTRLSFYNIENVSLDLDINTSRYFTLGQWPDSVKNFKSNAHKIYIYDTFLWDTIYGDIDKNWMTNFEFEYEDKGEKKVIKSNKFKKVKAIINNPRKYEWYKFKFPFKPGAKLTDILPWTKDMPDLDYISMRDNNVAMYFYKNKRELPLNLGWVETADGWWCGIDKCS